MSDSARLAVIVTGAGGGIGRSILDALLEVGARIVAVDLPSSDLASVVDVHRAAGHDIWAVHADPTDPDVAAALVADAEEQLGGLDALVHAVGVAGRGRIEEVDDHLWRTVIDGNLSSTFYLCRAMVPALRRRGRGSIVVLASAAGLRGWPGSVAYSASKAGVVGLTRTLAGELGPEDIRVWSLCPTAVDTRMVSDALAASDDPVAARAAYEAAQPMGRVIRPREIAEVVRHLLVDRPPFTPDPLVV